MVALAPLTSRIPLVALAAILMVVAAHVVEVAPFREIPRATESDAATMLLTLGVTVAFDLILAIEVGLIAAGARFLTRMSQLFHIDPTALGDDTDQAITHARRHLANHDHTHPTRAPDQNSTPTTTSVGTIVPLHS